MAPLVLLFGMPRSGTTWIGKIFDSHPDTLYRHEPDSRGTLNEIPLLAAVERAEAYREVIERFVRNLPDLRQAKVSGSLPVFAKSYYSPLSLTLRRAGIFGVKLLRRAFWDVPLLQFSDYSKFPQIRVVWKSIESLGRLGIIARVSEPCVAIQILRHPCGYVASVLRGEARKSFESVEQSSEDYGVFEILCETPQARAYGLSLRTLEEM